VVSFSVKDDDVIKRVHSQAMGWYKRQPPEPLSREVPSEDEPNTVNSLDSRIIVQDKLNHLPQDRTPLFCREHRHVSAQTSSNCAVSTGEVVQTRAKDDKYDEDDKVEMEQLIRRMSDRFRLRDVNETSILSTYFRSWRLDSQFLMRNCTFANPCTALCILIHHPRPPYICA